MKKNIGIVICILFYQCTYSQIINYTTTKNGKSINPITTAVPFLLVNPNAQSTGIADIGVVAATPYYESGLTQNPSLLAKNEKVMGLKFSYKPWLLNLVPDINMTDACIYYAITKKITVGYSFNYFSLGSRTFVNANGMGLMEAKAKEFYHNLRYAQRINANLSVGAGLKYVVSDLTNNQPFYGQPTYSGKALAVDLGMDYSREFAKKETSFWRFNAGTSVLNIGKKIKYMDSQPGDFMPIQLAIGAMWTYTKDIHSNLRYCLDLAYQGEKLLVPTPPTYKHLTDSSGYETNIMELDANNNPIIIAGKDPNRSVASGIFGSFTDAPDGVSEEFAEIIHKVGIENRLIFNQNLAVALRTGVFNENKRKGNRKYLTAGTGIRYKFIYLDFGMILFYNTSPATAYKTTYVCGIKNPNSYSVTLGFKYTFKEKTDSDAKDKED